MIKTKFSRYADRALLDVLERMDPKLRQYLSYEEVVELQDQLDKGQSFGVVRQRLFNWAEQNRRVENNDGM